MIDEIIKCNEEKQTSIVLTSSLESLWKYTFMVSFSQQWTNHTISTEFQWINPLRRCLSISLTRSNAFPSRKWWKTTIWYVTWTLVKPWVTPLPSVRTKLEPSPPTEWLWFSPISVKSSAKPHQNLALCRRMLETLLSRPSRSTLPIRPGLW